MLRHESFHPIDKTVLDEALIAAAIHRGTTHQIDDTPSILHNIKESTERRAMWDTYRKQFAYAKDIEYERIIAVLKLLFK